jgi:hypothetical protein
VKKLLILAGAAAFVAAAPAVAKPGHGKGHGNSAKHARYYGYAGNCPPGLSKHEGHCMPHGQFKKRYNVGQRFNTRYGDLWSYNQIPYDLRQRYDLERRYRYYYGDGYLYRVDPRTMLVSQVVNAILR